jgi:hypothetical protein
MSAISTIARVLDNLSEGPLMRSMVWVPSRGATKEELVAEDRMLPRPLSTCHRGLLKRWNGICLDMLRLFGAGHTHPRIKPLHRKQMNLHREFPEDHKFISREMDLGITDLRSRTMNHISRTATVLSAAILPLVTGAAAGAQPPDVVASDGVGNYPDLVIRDRNGTIQGIRYDELAPLLLNEVQQQQLTLAAQAEALNELRQELRDLKDSNSAIRASMRRLRAMDAPAANR